MNPRIALKTFIDAAMLVFYLQLMFCYGENPLYHEVVGIGVGALCLLHLALNKTGIVALSRKLGKEEVRPRHIIAAVLDTGLLVTMAATVVTGMLVARDLYVGPGGADVAEIHNTVSYVCLAIIAAHTIQHIPYLVGIFRPRSARKGAPKHANGAGQPASTTAMVPLSSAPRRRAASSNMLSRRQFLAGSVVAASAVLAIGTTAFMKSSGVAAAEDSTSASNGTGGTDSSSGSAEGAGPDGSFRPDFRPGGRPDRGGDSSSDSNSGFDSSSGSDSGSDSDSSSSSSSTTVCTICRKRCPISNLRCQKGVDWAEQNGLI